MLSYPQHTVVFSKYANWLLWLWIKRWWL